MASASWPARGGSNIFIKDTMWIHEASDSYLYDTYSSEYYLSFELFSEVIFSDSHFAEVPGNLINLATLYHVDLTQGDSIFDWKFSLSVFLHSLYNLGSDTVQFIHTVSNSTIAQTIIQVIKYAVISSNPALVIGYFLIKDVILPSISIFANAVWGFLQSAYVIITEYAPIIKAVFTDLIQLAILVMFFITPILVSMSMGKLANFFILSSQSTNASLSYLQIEGEKAYQNLSRMAEFVISTGKRVGTLIGGLIK